MKDLSIYTIDKKITSISVDLIYIGGKDMNKLSKIVIATIVALGLLVACGGKGSSSDAKVKLGIASTQVITEKDNSGKFDTVFVGVALKDGKVSYLSIDNSEQAVEVVDGALSMNAQASKYDLKEDYNMKGSSAIGKEWYEQMDAVAKDLNGKTLEEVKAYFEGEEVKSSASIYIDSLAATVIKAIENATVEVSGVAKIGFGHSISVSAKEESAQSVVDYALVAVDADGKIVSVLLDNAQEKAKLVDGVLTPENIGKTKGELKADYGMKKASAIEKEWNEQNDALMAALVGKTFAEVSALDADGKNNEETKSSATIVIAGAQAAIKDAEAKLTELK